MKTKNIIKGLVIFSLVLLTFFQISELWFGGSSNTNFFYSFFSPVSSPINSENLSKAIKPYRIIAGEGDNKFLIKYSDIEIITDSGVKKSIQKDEMDKVILGLFEYGEFVKSGPVNWPEILQNKIMLAEYKFSMPTDVFTECYRIQKTTLSSRFNKFDSIAIIPLESGGISALFINNAENECHEYLVKSGDSNAMLNAIQSISVYNDKLYYTSSVLEGLDAFSGNVFLPKWDFDPFTYSSIVSINPYMENGNILYSTIEKKIDVFFANPALKRPSNLNDVYTFSDENTVVRYYSDGILEYNNFKAVDSKPNCTFSSAFSSAIEFINNDSTIDGDFYLSDYTSADDGTWVFFFDFVINDYPLILSQSLSMPHSVEITVSYDRVTKYKHYAYTYELAEQAMAAVSSQFLNGIREESTYYDPAAIDELTICYKVDDSQILKLYWKIGMYGSVSLTPAS